MSDFTSLTTRFFFFNDTATTEIYTLSLHDALPICRFSAQRHLRAEPGAIRCALRAQRAPRDGRGLGAGGSGANAVRADCGTKDRKSTRLNSSHANISYAVFCLKKKNATLQIRRIRQ